MHKKILITVKLLVFCSVLVLFGILISRKIDLATADLGRHIQNGSVILHGSWPEKRAVLTTNFYSYTQGDLPFVNHHWGSGVIFYSVFVLAGFAGISAFYIFFSLLTFGLYYSLAIKWGGWLSATALVVLFAPLAASRAEVRPEVFTYLFSGVFFLIVSAYTRQPYLDPPVLGNKARPAGRWLWALPFLMFVWVNLHIGFVFGFFILGAFGLTELIKNVSSSYFARGFKTKVFSQIFGKKFGKLFLIGLLCAVAACINPWFVKGVLYPFSIFRNYGYLIVENQSIPFLQRLGVGDGFNFGLYQVALAITAVSFLLAWNKLRPAEGIIVAVLGLLAYEGIRHFPSFALMALPVASGNINQFLQGGSFKAPARARLYAKVVVYPLLFFAVLVGGFKDVALAKAHWSVLGLGLLPGQMEAADFFYQNGLIGPVFNNYDIGGYLIYALFPREKVFVDNRPEAYTEDFFEKVYKPMQTDSDRWLKQSEIYQFNSIIFSHRDYTPWGQQFLVDRVKDPKWAVVYYDSYVIIMLKHNPKNDALIKKYEIPKTVFSVK